MSVASAGLAVLSRVADTHAHVKAAPQPATCSPAVAGGGGGGGAAEEAISAMAGGGCCGVGKAGPSTTATATAMSSSAGTETAETAATGPGVVVVCGTHPAIDWDAVEALAGRPGVIIGFGIHPWYVPELDQPSDGDSVLSLSSPAAALLEELERRLTRNPAAIVGEIGLDKLRGPSQRAQVELVLGQMRLAARFGRPVSMHCVRHYGLLLDVLGKELKYVEEVPPAIVLHGFTGGCSVAQSLLKLKNKKDSAPAAAAPPEQPIAARRPGVVKIKDRIFFGVGAATTLTVKDTMSATLPLLMASRRALAETDRFYDSAYLQQLKCGTIAVTSPTMTSTETARAAAATNVPAGGVDADRTNTDAMSNNSSSSTPHERGNGACGEERETQELLAPVIDALLATATATAGDGDNAPTVEDVATMLDETFRTAFASVL